jgi:hypothetical protein
MRIKTRGKSLITYVLFFLIFSGCAGRLPKDVTKAIFEKSDFAIPITLRIPCQDNPRKIETLKKYRGGLPPAGVGSRFIHYPKEIVDVLVKHGYMNAEKIRMSSRYYSGGSQIYEFPKYTEKIYPYVHKITYEGLSHREIEFSKANLEECRKSPHSYKHIKLATRVLKSIDYKERYKEPATEWTPAYDVITIRFSYVLKKDFPHAEELAGLNVWPPVPLKKGCFNTVYEGEAKVYSGSDSSRWIAEDIILEDMRL